MQRRGASGFAYTRAEMAMEERWRGRTRPSFAYKVERTLKSNATFCLPTLSVRDADW